MTYQEMLAAPMQAVIAEECGCVSCQVCNGTGDIWFDFCGRYLGNSRCDDLDQLEPCEDCGGSGITQTCDRCQLLQERDWDNP